MKTCKYCDEPFDEAEEDTELPGQLGAMFLDRAGYTDSDDVCPRCKEELGILSLIGTGE